jgi:hypothetical protein
MFSLSYILEGSIVTAYLPTAILEEEENKFLVSIIDESFTINEPF